MSKRSLNRQYQRRQERRINKARRFAPAATGKILAAYIPIPAVWQTTGYGTVAIAREVSNGKLRYAFAMLDLQRGGLYIPGETKEVEVDEGLADLEDFLKDEKIPASIPGDPDLAGKLVFGAYALSLERDHMWPESIENVLHLFPRPTGYFGDWLGWLKSSDSGIGKALWRLVDHQPDIWEEIPDDKDPIVVTSITFSVSNSDHLLELLQNSDPEFVWDGEDGDGLHFIASRAYPKRSWNPVSRVLGERQTIGHVTGRNRSFTIEANTLSFAARIFSRIIQLYGPGIEVQSARYDDMNLALRTRRSNS